MSTVLTEVADGVAVMIINRPEARNAVNLQVAKELAARDAKFGLPEVKRGLVAAGGGVLRLPKALPYQLAMEVALTGDPFTAEFAHAHGLVNHLTDPGKALDGARELAARIAVNSPLAARASKQIISAAVRYTDANTFAAQQEIVAPVMTSADALEGAVAFAEKRPPVWRGE